MAGDFRVNQSWDVFCYPVLFELPDGHEMIGLFAKDEGHGQQSAEQVEAHMDQDAEFDIALPENYADEGQHEEELGDPVIGLPEVIDGEQGGFDDGGPAAKAGETGHEIAAEIELFNQRRGNPVQQQIAGKGDDQHWPGIGCQQADVAQFEPLRQPGKLVEQGSLDRSGQPIYNEGDDYEERDQDEILPERQRIMIEYDTFQGPFAVALAALVVEMPDLEAEAKGDPDGGDGKHGRKACTNDQRGTGDKQHQDEDTRQQVQGEGSGDGMLFACFGKG